MYLKLREKVTKEDLIKAFKEARASAKKNFTKEEIKKKTKEAKEEMDKFKPESVKFVQKI